MPAFIGKGYCYERGNPKTFKVGKATPEQLRRWFPFVRETEVEWMRNVGPTKAKAMTHFLLSEFAALVGVEEEKPAVEKLDQLALARKAKADKAAAEKAAKAPVLDPLPGLSEDTY